MRVIAMVQQRVVGVAVAALVEPVADDLARRRFDWCGAAQVRERTLVAQSARVVAGGDEQLPALSGPTP